MSQLQTWENKIKLKRAKTPFREFVRDIASSIPLVFHKFWSEISRYPETPRKGTLLSSSDFENQRGNFCDYGREYDFSKDFFQNYSELLREIPFQARLTDVSSQNASYAEAVRASKNVYLSNIVIDGCENIFYTFYAQDYVKNCFNSVMVWDHSENVYYGVGIIRWFNIFYSRYIVNSNNIWFSSNLIGCSECICCDNLENTSFCIQNIKYEKEEYLRRKQEILSNPFQFEQLHAKVNTKANNLSSKQVSGQFCVYSENVENGFFAYRVENARNIFFVWEKDGRKNVLDTFCSDQAGVGDIYACSNIGSAANVYFSDCITGQNLYYCFNCIHCSYCFGCSWLKNESYCILSKKYPKEEWYKLVDAIFAQMEQDGILWKTLPAKYNPFYFNDTLASLVLDFHEAEVTQQGYMWRQESIKVDIEETGNIISPEQIRDFQKLENGKLVIDESILQKIIRDKKGDFYKIIAQEREFLQKYGLPIPTEHWLQRIRSGFQFKM